MSWAPLTERDACLQKRGCARSRPPRAVETAMATATSAELREQSRQYREIAEKEITVAIKQRLASHALALAQLAEKIERDVA